jgi:DNA-binding NtrC family response regulator
VAATHRDLKTLVRDGRFREDLFYRLSAVEIIVPSLSQRREDLPLLQHYFVERCATDYNKPLHSMTRRVQTLFSRYHWPGNVRELENAISNACMMATSDTIDVADLPESLRASQAIESSNAFDLATMEEMQRRHAVRVLEAVGGNKVKAAEVLGISRGSLYRLLRESGASASNSDDDSDKESV